MPAYAPDEVFDVTPYSRALAKFLMGHPDCQNFGRKFKPAFSGCAQHACGLTNMHDLGFIATTRVENGKEKRGFAMYVGGGLGAVPYQAKLFDSFVPVEEMLPLAQAIARVYARLGEKKNRNRARIKFLVQDLGIEKFKELVLEERKTLPHDPRWTEFVADAEKFEEAPLKPPGEWPAAASEAFQQWLKTNTRPQKQKGYVVVTVALPLGDITANQLRSLADIVRRFTKETVRTTVEQNFVIRWVSQSDLPELYKALEAAELAAPGAGTIVDIVTCPGTDTCKLGISSSRGLAAELRKEMARNRREIRRGRRESAHQDQRLLQQLRPASRGGPGLLRRQPQSRRLRRAALSGGARRRVGAQRGFLRLAGRGGSVEEYSQGGHAADRALSGGPHQRRNVQGFRQAHRQSGNEEHARRSHQAARRRPLVLQRLGRSAGIQPGRQGVGECAGEVVSPVEFELAAAESEVFEAQIAFENGRRSRRRATRPTARCCTPRKRW